MSQALLDAVALLRDGHWDAAHDVAQRHDSPEAAWLHGLVHVQEGDLENAAYWYARAGRPFHRRLSLAEELSALERQLRAAPASRAPE